MGMYDYVDVEIACPRCSNKLNGFQTKYGPCLMHTLQFWEVDEFYCNCVKCGTFVKFVLPCRPNREIKIDDYDRVVTYLGIIGVEMHMESIKNLTKSSEENNGQ